MALESGCSKAETTNVTGCTWATWGGKASTACWPRCDVIDSMPGSVGRELADAEAAIADTKRAYYDALNRRHRALSALARETNQ